MDKTFDCDFRPLHEMRVRINSQACTLSATYVRVPLQLLQMARVLVEAGERFGEAGREDVDSRRRRRALSVHEIRQLLPAKQMNVVTERTEKSWFATE